MRNMKPATMVDRLGDLQATAADIQDKIDELKERLAELGEAEITGSRYRVTVSPSQRATIDGRGLAEYCQVPRRVLARYTTVTEFTRVQVHPR